MEQEDECQVYHISAPTFQSLMQTQVRMHWCCKVHLPLLEQHLAGLLIPGCSGKSIGPAERIVTLSMMDQTAHMLLQPSKAQNQQSIHGT
jgi:hypothetical protein